MEPYCCGCAARINPALKFWPCACGIRVYCSSECQMMAGSSLHTPKACKLFQLSARVPNDRLLKNIKPGVDIDRFGPRATSGLAANTAERLQHHAPPLGNRSSVTYGEENPDVPITPDAAFYFSNVNPALLGFALSLSETALINICLFYRLPLSARHPRVLLTELYLSRKLLWEYPSRMSMDTLYRAAWGGQYCVPNVLVPGALPSGTTDRDIVSLSALLNLLDGEDRRLIRNAYGIERLPQGNSADLLGPNWKRVVAREHWTEADLLASVLVNTKGFPLNDLITKYMQTFGAAVHAYLTAQ